MKEIKDILFPLLDGWLTAVVEVLNGNIQRMVDGSASKPVLRQDTGYMVEKTYYDIAPYLMPQ